MAIIETVTKEELLQKITEGEDFELVNVLEPSSYLLGFIKGSKRIPVSQLDARIDELDINKEVVVYCASVECSAAKKAAERLDVAGFNVRVYAGGILEWKEAGLPMEPGIRVAA